LPVSYKHTRHTLDDHIVSKTIVIVTYIKLTSVGFDVLLGTLQVILKTIFPANLMSDAKHPSAFSTNHLADTKHDHNQNNRKT